MDTVFLISALLIVSFIPPAVSSQDVKEDQNNPFRELLARMTPEARLKYERLRKAEFASLELARRPLEYGEPPERLREPYKEGDRIYLYLVITNNSIENVSFARVDFYQEHRPRLTRDGDPVPYRSKISALVIEKDKQIVGRSVNSATLRPGETVEESVDLADWYEPLPPGHYQLTVRRRFIWGGDWVESPATRFEVNPKQDGAKKENKNGHL